MKPPILAAIFIIALLYSCKMNQNKNLSGEEIPAEFIQKQETIVELSGYPLPTSFHLTKMLNEAKAPYILSLSNDVKNAGNYFSQKDKALNLGIYGADLSYAATYLMSQETLSYMETAKKLREELNIAPPFNSGCYKKVENNLSNRDSLISIISDSFYHSYNYLKENRRDSITTLIMAGSWIEGLYITSQIALTAGNNTELLEIIKEQGASLEKLLEIMEAVRDSAGNRDIYPVLKKLKKSYGLIKGEISEELLLEINIEISSIRNSITG